MSGGVGPASALLSQSVPCLGGGFGYKPKITAYSFLLLLQLHSLAPVTRPQSPAGYCFRLQPHGLAGTGIRELCLTRLGSVKMKVLTVLLGMLGFLGVVPESSAAHYWENSSCYYWNMPIPGSPLGSLSFLAKDAQGLALFHAHWDAHGRLQVCSWQDEPELIEVFSDLCAHEPTRGFFIHKPGSELLRALASLYSQWETCQGPSGARVKRAAEQSGAPGRRHLRMKRGWTIPGTLWCGVGDSAGNSSELGEPWGVAGHLVEESQALAIGFWSLRSFFFLRNNFTICNSVSLSVR